MTDRKKANRFGGSAAGGGMDYQAEAYAFIAASILAEHQINWFETCSKQIPLVVQLETGSGGDDLRVDLVEGAKVEIQAKSGLQRGDDLWDAIISLASAIHKDSNTHGVLLINNASSRTIRIDLRSDIVKLGQGVDSDLHDIGKELVQKLIEAKLNKYEVCSRLRIQVWDFDPGSQGEESTLQVLQKIIRNPQQDKAARSVLVSDGMDLIKLRGQRDARGLATKLIQEKILLTQTAEKTIFILEGYLKWCVDTNQSILLPHLEIQLPISLAWDTIQSLDKNEFDKTSSISKIQFRDYREWYRLTVEARKDHTFILAKILNRYSFMVIVGGPGTGKSTLLRKIAWLLAKENKLVLKVSLKVVAAYMRTGLTFEDSLKRVAFDGFPADGNQREILILNTHYLLADGLDETGLEQAVIAEKLKNWSISRPKCQIIVTTRPIDYNSAWFNNWHHFELVPLSSQDVEHYSNKIFDCIPTETTPDNRADLFLNEIRTSKTASIASKNPQLLSFLIGLFLGGYKLSGNRYELFSRVIEDILRQPRLDKVSDTPIPNFSTTLRVLELIGWNLLISPSHSRKQIEQIVKDQMVSELGLSRLQTEQEIKRVIDFCKERGLLNEFCVGSSTIILFVHMAFQEYAIASYLLNLPDHEYLSWVENNYMKTEVEEPLVFLGATKRLEQTVHLVLQGTSETDFVSTSPLLAAQILAEATAMPVYLFELISRHLTPRLVSSIPSIVDETVGALIPLARLRPDLIGPMAQLLLNHEQSWTREGACLLCLVAGKAYVDLDILKELYPKADEYHSYPGQRGLMSGFRPIIHVFIMEATKYFLELDKADSMVLFERLYQESHLSMFTFEELDKMLREQLPWEQMSKLASPWLQAISQVDMDTFLKIGKLGEEAFLGTILYATKEQNSSQLERDPSYLSIAKLWSILEIETALADDLYHLAKPDFLPYAAEVFRGAAFAGHIDMGQLGIDVNYAYELLITKNIPFYDLIWRIDRCQPIRELDWGYAKQNNLRGDYLIRAFHHPSGIVSRFAALLLVNCFDLEFLREQFTPLLQSASGYGLVLIAYFAQEIWGDDVCKVIINRLETNFTEDSAPLIELLGETHDASFENQVFSICEKALSVRNAQVVKTTIETVEKWNIYNRIHSKIKDVYSWWVNNGPQDPKVSGVVPENPASNLFILLVRHKDLDLQELRDALNVDRSDVRQEAVKAFCLYIVEADNESLTDQIFNEISLEQLPSNLLKEWSRQYPEFCAHHLEHFVNLLNVTNTTVKTTVIKTFRDGWFPQELGEQLLRPHLNAPDVETREAVVDTLRSFQFSEPS